jgi:hypothetical protein
VFEIERDYVIASGRYHQNGRHSGMDGVSRRPASITAGLLLGRAAAEIA